MIDKNPFTRQDRQGTRQSAKREAALVMARLTNSESKIIRSAAVKFQIEESLDNLLCSGSPLLYKVLDFTLGNRWIRAKVIEEEVLSGGPICSAPEPASVLPELRREVPEVLTEIIQEALVDEGLTELPKVDIDRLRDRVLRALRQQERAKKKRSIVPDIPNIWDRLAFARRVQANNFRPRNLASVEKTLDYYLNHQHLPMICDRVDESWRKDLTFAPSRSRVYRAYYAHWLRSPSRAETWLTSVLADEDARKRLRKSDERRHREAHEELMSI